MKRLYLAAREYVAILESQNGVGCVEECEESEVLIAEHSTPNALRPGKPDQLVFKGCQKVKTFRDVRGIATANRMKGETMSQDEWRIKYGSMLQGRGVDGR